ncbi:hypothetical protein ACJMK2_019042 [Sinanodonta woodiana]|uniref:SAM domain-containing protein n=1 Tax=Sinanodonta woodiana TaxID=1069815 RepID=A0ABD3UHY5_SINWO
MSERTLDELGPTTLFERFMSERTLDELGSTTPFERFMSERTLDELGSTTPFERFMSERILDELGLSTLCERFQLEGKDASMIMSLSDSELIHLVVDTIGDRHRLQETINQNLKNTFANEPTETGTNNNITSSRVRISQEIAHEHATLFNGQIRGHKDQSPAAKVTETISMPWLDCSVCVFNKQVKQIYTNYNRKINITQSRFRSEKKSN